MGGGGGGGHPAPPPFLILQKCIYSDRVLFWCHPGTVKCKIVEFQGLPEDLPPGPHQSSVLCSLGACKTGA